MPGRQKMILKKSGTIVYQVKADDDLIWEGLNIAEVFPQLQEAYPGRNLSIVWRTQMGADHVK